jgi:glutamate synthase (NADPH/NADH) large chain
MVALEPLNDIEETLNVPLLPTTGAFGAKRIAGGWLRHDAQRLRILVARHYLHTGSEPARRVLEQWRELLPKFVKIMPLDYRRALQDMQQIKVRAARLDEKAGVAVGV